MTEKERWSYGICTLLAAALVLLLLVALLNPRMIFVDAYLTIYQVLITIIGIASTLGIALWMIGLISEAIGNAEARINRNLESLRKTLLRATNKFGADFLAFVTGLLGYLIQEVVADYPEQYKVAICVLFTLNFFLASQLIGSERRSDKVLGIFFFVSPVALFATSVLVLVSPQAVLSWLRLRSISDIIMMCSVLFTTLLTFVFAFFKEREE